MEPDANQFDSRQLNETGSTSGSAPLASEEDAFFQRVDWLSFGLATVLALAVYLFTLAPEVTLEMSGMLSTAAMYGGVPHPPGFPLWTLYTWLFTKLLPFSNIAWRVAVSSAVASAATCGVIALMVSRCGAVIIEGIPGFRRLEPGEERLLRLVAGFVAGMSYGFNGVSWGIAVVVDTRPPAICLFSIVLCLLARWWYAPARRRYLYTAFFVFGLTVSASPMLMPAALGLPFFVMCADAAIGRELFFAAAVVSAAIGFTSRRGYLPLMDPGSHGTQAIYTWIAVLTGAMCLGLIVKTRRFLTRWQQAATAGLLSVLGLTPFFYLPIASMTNPPSNWGYARTVEGFFHVLGRGQFERLIPTSNIIVFLRQMGMYAEIASKQYGLLSLMAALAPSAVSQGHSDSAVEQGLNFSQATNPARWRSESPGARRQLALGPSPPSFGGGPYLGPANGMRFG